jgi:hypothetical protein
MSDTKPADVVEKSLPIQLRLIQLKQLEKKQNLN